MVNAKNVTPGYWWVLTPTGFEIVKTFDSNSVLRLENLKYFDKNDPNFTFVSHIEEPLYGGNDITQIKKDLGLPASASTAEMFKKALDVAKSSIEKVREEKKKIVLELMDTMSVLLEKGYSSKWFLENASVKEAALVITALDTIKKELCISDGYSLEEVYDKARLFLNKQ